LEGQWVGTVEVADDLIFARAELIRSWTGLSGSLRLQGMGELALVWWSGISDDLVFEMEGSGEEFIASGRVSRDGLTGTLNRGGERVPFHLHRIAQLDPRRLQDFAGTYFAEPDWVRPVYVCGDVLGLNQLVAVYGKTGARKALFPINENSFFFGPGFLIPDPMEGRVTFLRDADGRPDRLLWEGSGFTPTIGERLPGESSTPLAQSPGAARCERLSGPVSSSSSATATSRKSWGDFGLRSR